MNNKQIAEDIADRLLKNGFGEVGHRLAIRQGPFGLERDLGGWGRDVIVNEVDKILNTNPSQISTSAVDPKDALIRELVGALQQWEDALTAAVCHDGVHIELVSEVAQASRKGFDTLALARTTCPEAFE